MRESLRVAIAHAAIILQAVAQRLPYLKALFLGTLR